MSLYVSCSATSTREPPGKSLQPLLKVMSMAQAIDVEDMRHCCHSSYNLRCLVSVPSGASMFVQCASSLFVLLRKSPRRNSRYRKFQAPNRNSNAQQCGLASRHSRDESFQIRQPQILGLHLVDLLSAVYFMTPIPPLKHRNRGVSCSRCNLVLSPR
jgi:hypothetical protein